MCLLGMGWVGVCMYVCIYRKVTPRDERMSRRCLFFGLRFAASSSRGWPLGFFFDIDLYTDAIL